MRIAYVPCSITLSSVECLAVPYFSKFSEKKSMEHEMCVLNFSTSVVSETFLILRRIQQETSIFLTDFWKFLIKILWKSVQWGWVIPCGQTDGETWWNLQSLFAILWTHLKICYGSGTEVGQPAPSGVLKLPHYECYKRYKKLGLIKSGTFYLTPLLSCPWNCFYGYNWKCIQVCSFMQMCFDQMGHHQCSSK